MTGGMYLENRYAVVGNPIAQSRSPEIHLAFAAQFGDVIEYTKHLVTLDGFGAHAQAFAAAGGCGLNVTVPFKTHAFKFVDECDDAAAAAGSVNTILFQPDGGSRGCNTDGVGLLNDIKYRHGVYLTGASVLLLGAGGAAAGVVLPLLNSGVAQLMIANRSKDKALALVAKFETIFAQKGVLSALGLDEIPSKADVIINATSFSLTGGSVPLKPSVVQGAFCYDMNYGKSAEFCRWASANAAKCSVDGLGMLVEQAAEAYWLWHAKRPNTEAVMTQLKRLMAAPEHG